jgi:cytochrome c2
MNEDRVLFAEPIDIDEPVHAMTQLRDGTMLLWTGNGKFVELRALEAWELPTARFTEAQKRLGVDRIIESCSACHGFSDGQTLQTTGPTLWGIYGRAIATADYEYYSDALRRLEGAWNEHTLADYLRDPQRFAPGTTMPAQAIGDAQALDALIEYLRGLR